jgi:hypothetical protein
MDAMRAAELAIELERLLIGDSRPPTSHPRPSFDGLVGQTWP